MKQEVGCPDYLTVEGAGIQVHLGSKIFSVKYIIIFFSIRTWQVVQVKYRAAPLGSMELDSVIKFCLFDFLLNIHGKTAEVISGWSVILTTLFLGRLHIGI